MNNGLVILHDSKVGGIYHEYLLDYETGVNATNLMTIELQTESKELLDYDKETTLVLLPFAELFGVVSAHNYKVTSTGYTHTITAKGIGALLKEMPIVKSDFEQCYSIRDIYRLLQYIDDRLPVTAVDSSRHFNDNSASSGLWDLPLKWNHEPALSAWDLLENSMSGSNYTLSVRYSRKSKGVVWCARVKQNLLYSIQAGDELEYSVHSRPDYMYVYSTETPEGAEDKRVTRELYLVPNGKNGYCDSFSPSDFPLDHRGNGIMFETDSESLMDLHAKGMAEYQKYLSEYTATFKSGNNILTPPNIGDTLNINIGRYHPTVSSVIYRVQNGFLNLEIGTEEKAKED